MSFKEALRKKDFVIAAELPLSPDSSRESVVAAAQTIAGCVDGILLTDNQYGQTHMSPAAAAGILVNAGMAPIVQLSCRNRNRIALIGELLGARATGVDSVVLVRGTTVPEGIKPVPKAVADIGVRELIATALTINDDEKLGSSRDFLIGASATVHRPMPNWHPEELLAKADAGAQMIITQLCLDAEMLRQYMVALVETKLVQRLYVIVSIAAVSSASAAAWLRDNRRLAVVPQPFIDQLRQAEDAADEGVNLSANLLREIAAIPGVSGVNFVASGNLESIPRIIAQAGIAS